MPSFRIIDLKVLNKNTFEGFIIYEHGGYLVHVIWTINTNLTSPLHIEDPHAIWPWLAEWFQRFWKLVDADGRTDDRAFVYYKRTL